VHKKSPPKPSRALLDFDGAKVVEKQYRVKTLILPRMPSIYTPLLGANLACWGQLGIILCIKTKNRCGYPRFIPSSTPKNT